MANLLYTDDNWLGEVPAHWPIVPSKSLFTNPVERNHGDDIHLTPSQKFGVIPQSEYMEMTGSRVVLNLNGADNMRHVEPGDFVSHLRSFQGGLEYSAYKGKVSSAYTVLRPKKQIESRFYKYLFKSDRYVQGLATTTEQLRDGQSIRYQQFSLLPLPYPPVEEQKAIADFLDRELAEIDQLIDTQDGLIALLGKRRQSAITSAVTNGLAADVETESSGNHWLGKIPSHWTMKPLKYLVSLNPTALPESTSDEFEFNYIEISDVTKEHGVKGSSRQRFSTAPSRARRLVQENDVLVSTVRTYLRAVGLVPEVQDGLPFVASTGFAALRPTGVNPNFLSYALTAEHFVAQVESRSTGISYPAINASDLVSIAIPVPPFEEQIQIARHLDNQLTQLDALVSVTKEAIERLYERRSAVVSAAVTGKVDVWGKN